MARLADIMSKAQARRAVAHELRESGKTFREIGTIMGVSAAVARGCAIAGEREKRVRVQQWHSGLSSRTANTLINNNVKDRTDAEKFAEDACGRLHLIPNFGKRSLAELRLWLADQLPENGHDAVAAIDAEVERMALVGKGITKEQSLRRRLKAIERELVRADEITEEREQIMRELGEA